MPYNTRRKSLSLPSLGIHVPVTHAARAAALAAANAASASEQRLSSASNSAASLTSSMPPPSSTASSLKRSSTSSATSDASSTQPPSSKRTKRRNSSISSGRNEPLSSLSITAVAASAKPVAAATSTEVATPPQSPQRPSWTEVETGEPDVEEAGIDMDEVNDDIVEAVILQLKTTSNRPHLIKELSAVLMTQLKSVQQSANPCAIISSRLASYMKRSCWSATKVCPLTKELEAVHPRRTYYYLNTCPHLPLLDASSVHFIVPRNSIVTPPLSSAVSGSEAAEEERRRELSPSPEVDLSSPEFDDLDDDIPMPGTPVADRYPRYTRLHYVGGHRHRASSVHHNQHQHHHYRGASPPLEKDEKEFTQTAEGLQKRKRAGKGLLLSPACVATQTALPSNSMYLDADAAAGREESMLFGAEPRRNSYQLAFFTSPALLPMPSPNAKRETDADNWANLDNMVAGWDQCAESIELDELDCLLDEF